MDDSEIILSNLHRSQRIIAEEWEIRLSHLADLAAALPPLRAGSAEGGEDEELESAFSGTQEEIKRLRDTLLQSAPPSERDGLERALDGDSSRAVAKLCEMICERSPSGSDELTVRRIERARIAYFPTALCKQAWQAISRELPMSTAAPFDSFAAACEEVYAGRYDFCILPRSGSDEGMLLPFFRLASRYELLSVMGVDVRSGDENLTRLHLCGSRLIRTRAADYMDVCLHMGADRLWCVLDGIHQLGAFCENLTALPRSLYGEDAFLLTLRPGRCNPEAILLYLSLSVPAFSLEGIYKLLTTTARSADERP